MLQTSSLLINECRRLVLKAINAWSSLAQICEVNTQQVTSPCLVFSIATGFRMMLSV